ncbi:MAG: hypothetical protein GY815_05085 [Gammaproteobacteria bacterium]|nr:hypothetical protein [Gammaproteobacteria bacterium]
MIDGDVAAPIRDIQGNASACLSLSTHQTDSILPQGHAISDTRRGLNSAVSNDGDEIHTVSRDADDG